MNLARTFASIAMRSACRVVEAVDTGAHPARVDDGDIGVATSTLTTEDDAAGTVHTAAPHLPKVPMTTG